jgi:uncharacterized membrane protein
MRNLSTTVAVYDDMAAAEADWAKVEEAATNGVLDLADAALVQRDTEGVRPIQRHSHKGWGKGAVAGAVVGILFPPAIVAGAVVGAGGGAVLARLNRSFDRGDIKDLGEVMDSGAIALVVLTSDDTTGSVAPLLGGARRSLTRSSSTAEELMEALNQAAQLTAS